MATTLSNPLTQNLRPAVGARWRSGATRAARGSSAREPSRSRRHTIHRPFPSERAGTGTGGFSRMASGSRSWSRGTPPATALPELLVGVPALFQSVLSPSPGLAPAVAANTAVFVLGITVLLRGLSWAGVVNAWFLGTAVMAAFGGGGYALVCLYFVFGSAVTKLKLEQKQAEGIAEARSGRRG
eukprot:CAMPEP_0198694066 /NCGR_PEP_ID=MMETSP1468-20131203/262521_1 /TAXON_ID=1461545 /ORGANISM="Mantoniella sp, Strain CCMP1436" /LENGTH=183 /DNA_ID=CAMNT_0044449041 /DNA_START=15 /DNA_END=562 /DNA_ORIENTATION=+